MAHAGSGRMRAWRVSSRLLISYSFETVVFSRADARGRIASPPAKKKKKKKTTLNDLRLGIPYISGVR
ncbi:hypothetical protein OPV22_031680 [Ensete ventricosum]|uniref:Uncharacterized protein n=1 Tax=Ensete ventricosum TaxID=4639 RepID=A0AAV8PJL1_ENSVE|nr:hypothetical protein OPV22_031680 [Ensete ventricosum]